MDKQKMKNDKMKNERKGYCLKANDQERMNRYFLDSIGELFSLVIDISKVMIGLVIVLILLTLMILFRGLF